MNRFSLAATLGWLILSWSTGQAKDPALLEFNRDIRPILSDACFACHGPDKAKRKADLRLDTEEEGKHTIKPGKPDESELIKRIVSTDDTERMPPPRSGRQLTKQQIEILRRWVSQGGKWEKHWAFVAPKRPALPAVQNQKWPRNPIDLFILARLEQAGLTPSTEASKTTLLRRVTLDLTGLPPTPAEVDAFLADNAPDAYEKVVDRLLRSPRYGERMALDWLDAARYADSNGYQQDRTRTMWPWRDWVVEAFNTNMPFDRFTVEQLAGDLLPHATLKQKIATGFNRNHLLNGEGGRIPEESRVDYVVDRVETTSTVWLGLTLGCARCHNHKYDPFTLKDFYSLYAYFNNLPESGSVDRGGNAAPVLKVPSAAQAQELTRLKHEISSLENQLKSPEPVHPIQFQRMALAGFLRLPPNSWPVLSLPDHVIHPSATRRTRQQKLATARKALDAVNKAIPETMVMEERPQPRETHILIRGAYDKYGDRVTPGTPAALPPLPPSASPNRLALARWLVDPGNPLTARVASNRYWQLFFGMGLVKTPEDFGVQGEMPTHPELLDWLATEFIRTGWDVKKMHRLIVTSATYRQSSHQTPELRERDPENRLLARGPRYRLPSPIIRDQALAVSGLLVEKAGGPPVKPYQPPGIWEEMSFNQIKYVQDKGESLYRRSLYTFWRRTVGPPNLFDTSARQVCTVRQTRTNTPLHALILLNDVTFVEAARVMAQRVLEEGGATAPARLTYAFRLATGRKPSEAERQILQTTLARLHRHYQGKQAEAIKLISAGEAARNLKLDAAEHAAYAALCSLLLNLDEVITKE